MSVGTKNTQLVQTNLNAFGVMYADASGFVNDTTVGTSGQVLVSNGTGVAPTFQTLGGLAYYSLSPYIVGSDVHSQYATIGAAITAFNLAAVPGNIYLKPGTYTENFTLPINCNLIALEDGNQSTTIIIGKVTFTAAGASSISGIELQTNSDFALVVSGSNAANLTLNNCYLNCLNNTGISYTNSNATSSITVNSSYGNLGTTGIGLYSSSSIGTLSFEYSVLFNTGSSLTASSNSAGIVIFDTCKVSMATASSSTGVINSANTLFSTDSLNLTCVTTAGSGSNPFDFCRFKSGTASCISIGSGTTVIGSNNEFISSNSNAITGAGTFSYGSLSFNQQPTLNPTTLTPLYSYQPNITMSGYQVINAISTNHAATPYVVLATDYYVGVNTAAGIVTVQLPNAPVTNRIFVVKDTNGTSAASNITVTTVGGVVNIDGATTYILNINYEAISLRFNGTSYEVF